MTRSILISLAVLTLSTSVALAAQRTHHSRAGPSPVIWQGGVSSGDRDLYSRNLRDSGYDTKKNRNSFGNVATN
jgi:hypothetical protein